MPKTTTIGKYIIQRLEQAGVKHVFGIPGDYVLDFYDELVHGPLQHVGTCTEIGAGFAADAYARVNGLGALCITYCVGGLNAVNAVAGAYAEKSPLIVISGAPGLMERQRSPLLHHQVKDHRTQLQIYEKVTVKAVAIEDVDEAPQLIDEAFAACLRTKRPVYIELPRDIVMKRCEAPKRRKPNPLVSPPDVLEEALNEALGMLKKAKRPVILAGVEIHRFGLQDELLDLAEKTGLPIAATLLGKSIIREDHPQYVGVYEGAMGLEKVRKAVENSDCVVMLGAFMTDINLGIHTANLDVGKIVDANSERVSIRHHYYEGIKLRHFLEGLAEGYGKKRGKPVAAAEKLKPFKPRPKSVMTVSRLFARIDEFITKEHIVICDIGDSLFAAADLTIRGRTEFLSPAYYTSMGFAVPAAVGAQFAAPRLRPLVFVGDGAFQMTGQELSTAVKNELNPIVFVLNNKGYTTERYIKEGPFNDIHNWAYHRMTDLLQAGWGCEVRTEGEFEVALETAAKNKDAFSLINIHLDKMDRSDALARLGKRLAERD